MPEPVAKPVNVVWFDDTPKFIQEPQERLEQHGVVLHRFATLGETRDYLSRSVEMDGAGLPDVVVTDLRVDAPTGFMEESGLKLAAYTDGLYRQRVKVPARIGIASAYPDEIEKAKDNPDVELAFLYSTHDIRNGRFGSFLRDVKISTALLRRDMWCSRHLGAHKIQEKEGNKRYVPWYGVVLDLDDEFATVSVWNLTSITSQSIRYIPRPLLRRAGEFERHEPLRLLEVWDPTCPNEVQPSLQVEKLDHRFEGAYVTLRPDLDFSCFDECR
jgi:hypothetical protein